MNLAELVAVQEQQDSTLQTDVEIAFREAFDVDDLTVSREGNIVYFSGTVANRAIRINPIYDPQGYAWQLNGVAFSFPNELDLPLDSRQAILRAAILRLPEQRSAPAVTGETISA